MIARVFKFFFVVLIAAVSAETALTQDCSQFLFLNCPGVSSDTKSFVEGLDIQINGATSSDCGPDPRTGTWQWGDGTSTTGEYFPVSHRYAASGTYDVTFSVDGFTEQCTVRVDASPKPVPVAPWPWLMLMASLVLAISSKSVRVALRNID